MAVYQKYDSITKTSIWILLQPSAEVYEQLVEIAANFSNKADGSEVLLHFTFLWSIENNWRGYLNYLEQEMRHLVSLDYIILFRIDNLHP